MNGLFTQGTTTDFKYLHTERGIAYFEGGWWMLEEDRLENNRKLNNFHYPVALKRNDETKQITIDKTIYP
jgi:hypothetical protein